MHTMNNTATKINPENLINDLQNIIHKIDAHVQENTAAHRVEKQIFTSLLSLGLGLLFYFFQQFGSGDRGETVQLDDGRTVKRLPHVGHKNYQSVFGEIILGRTVYGTRVGQKIDYVPLDARLELPEGKHSYLLQQWEQQLAGEMTYEQSQKTIQMILEQKPSTHTLQRGTKTFGTSVIGFQDAKPQAAQAKQEQIVVSTVDGKGVPMREGDKKMALVGCSYTINPYLRTPESVLEALFKEDDFSVPENQVQRPKPEYKRVHTSLLRNEQDEMTPSMDAMYDWLEDEYKQRNPKHQQPHVALIDGQVSLAQAMQARFAEHDNYVEILDILHVAGYVWDAAKALYDKEKIQHFCAYFCMEKVLNGKASDVIYLLETLEEERELSKTDRSKLHSTKVYLSNNLHRMHYDKYLAAGYPIASGVIEGACRHVVKDRMERSGMRWTIEGAEALLKLRCLAINEEWQDYMDFHVKQESQRLYPCEAANDDEHVQIMPIAA